MLEILTTQMAGHKGFLHHLSSLSVLFYYPQFFVLGMLIALNQNRILSAAARNSRVDYGLWAFVLGLLLCWVHWSLGNNFIDGVGGSLVIAAILGSAKIRSWFEARVLVWLGKISYSLYLVHVPIILVAVILSHGRPSWIGCVLVTMVCLAVAVIFRSFVELPSVLGCRALFERLGIKPARAPGPLVLASNES
jgi:peptidoglycan/LPS O-acetylase OafA/YrhL